MTTAVVERMAQPTMELELVSDSEIALEIPRHLFLAGDLLDPARRKDINLPGGGEEVPNRCMWRTSGLLPRCEITPMEMWGDPMPLELFPAGIKPLKLKGSDVTNLGIGNPNVLNGKPLFFIPMYPGELIIDALGIASGERRGIVEITALRGVEYGHYDRELQSLFFPETYIRPVELSKVRAQIEAVRDAHLDPDVRSCGDDMLLSCDQFQEYAMERISIAQTQLQQRVHPQGHVYRITPKVRSFMAQLEVKAPAEGMEALHSSVAAAVANSGITPEQLDSIMAKQSAMFAAAAASAIREVLTSQATQGVQAEDTEPSE